MRFAWRVIGPGDGGFDAVDHFEGDDEAGGAVWIFTKEEDVVIGIGIAFGFGLRFGFGGGSGVRFAELFEEAEGALEGAFGGGSVAKKEVVLLYILGGPISGREAGFGAFMRV